MTASFLAAEMPRNDSPPAVERADLSLRCDQARTWPLPGAGETAMRFGHLAAEAAQDLVVGRLVEAHADAVAILAELGGPPVQAGQVWGVWAAGPADSVTAVPDRGGSWSVTGRKGWCSGAGLATHALVDALGSDGQVLYAVDLEAAGVSLGPVAWAGPGMARADTRSVTLQGVAAVPVGGPGDYLRRPGFWAGAAGVAACWHGGAVAVGRRLLESSRSSESPHLMAHLGAVSAILRSGHASLIQAGRAIDSRPAADHFVAAMAVRSTIERSATEVMDRVGRALGPAPLAHDGRHAAAVADLAVYIRQHHGEADLAELGRRVAADSDLCPW